MEMRRWYDQERICYHMLEHIRSIPQHEARVFCGTLLKHLSEQMRKRIDENNQNGLTSIGLQAIEGLYGFNRHNRRWYDHIPALHQGVSKLYKLPAEGLVALGFSAGDLFGLLSVYCQASEQLQVYPNSDQLTQITRKLLFESPDEAQALVRSLIGDDVFEVLFQPLTPALLAQA